MFISQDFPDFYIRTKINIGNLVLDIKNNNNCSKDCKKPKYSQRPQNPIYLRSHHKLGL